ncbi:hypothetical protein M0802_012645 [Mischocyttarus mexicanus]|nr:hypothetical protein M0802_012645 [Mischocyttarus mexicanus]
MKWGYEKEEEEDDGSSIDKVTITLLLYFSTIRLRGNPGFWPITEPFVEIKMILNLYNQKEISDYIEFVEKNVGFSH